MCDSTSTGVVAGMSRSASSSQSNCGFIELADVSSLASRQVVSAIEHDELPAALGKRIVALVEVQHLGRASLAPI